MAKRIFKTFIIVLSLFTITTHCFCDEYGTVYVDIPDLNGVTNEFKYTGDEIVFEIPESEYYTVGGNIQTEAGEYDAIIYLNKQNYIWRNGSRNDLFYHFTIDKVDYDLSDVIFDDKAVVADGNSYSLQVENLPESIDVLYSSEEISEPGSYTIVAVLTGDMNHNQIDPLTAKLYILEKPTEKTTTDISLGNVTGYIPYQTNVDVNCLDKNSDDYKRISNILINNKIDENDIFDIFDINCSYNFVDMDCHEVITYNIKNPEEEKINIYSISVDENGKEVVKKLKTKTSDDIISFDCDISYNLAFVRKKVNYGLYIGGAIILIALISLIVLAIIKKRKNRSSDSDGNKSIKTRRIKKSNSTSKYKRANNK